VIAREPGLWESPRGGAYKAPDALRGPQNGCTIGVNADRHPPQHDAADERFMGVGRVGGVHLRDAGLAPAARGVHERSDTPPADVATASAPSAVRHYSSPGQKMRDGFQPVTGIATFADGTTAAPSAWRHKCGAESVYLDANGVINLEPCFACAAREAADVERLHPELRDKEDFRVFTETFEANTDGAIDGASWARCRNCGNVVSARVVGSGRLRSACPRCGAGEAR